MDEHNLAPNNGFKPDEPNTKREIRIIYTTDSKGDMEIDLESIGFDSSPEMIPAFLTATLRSFKKP